MDKMRIEITVDGLTYGEAEKIDPSIDLEETAKSMVKKLTKNILKTRIISDITREVLRLESANLKPRYLFVDEKHYDALCHYLEALQPFGVSKFRDLKVLVDNAVKGFSIGV